MTPGPVRSLGGRLSFWLALQSLAGLAAVCTVVYVATLIGFESRQAQVLKEKEAQVRHLLSEAAMVTANNTLSHRLDDFLIGHQDLSLTLRRADGTLLYAPAGTAGRGISVVHARTHRFGVEALRLSDQPLQAELGLDVHNDRLLLGRIGLTLMAAALVGAALVSAGGYVLVRRGLKPVHALVEQTRLLAADTLHRRLDGSAQPEELAPLVAQFNQLLVRLEGAYQQLESFNADVAHELCTPLANLIGGTELALRKDRSVAELREVLGSNLEELHRIASIVQDMLFLSQADRGALARRQPVPSLAALVGKVASYHEAALADAGLELHIVGDLDGAFDTALLERAVSNLLSNATQYATPATPVRVDIAVSADQAELTVVNKGPTVAPEHLPHLFDRFYRVDPSRSGAVRNHGLGLAIVAAIARMHGGCTQAQSAAGVTAIGLRMPRCSPSATNN